MITRMHEPVLLKEAIEFLEPRKGDIVLDATIDGGGHAAEILKKISPGGKLIGIDQDKQLLDSLISKKNLVLLHGNFRNIDELLKPAGIEKVDKTLFDLGVSSRHFEESGRGFTFRKDEPLLMNLKFPSDEDDLTAEEILNRWREEDIFKILKEYGEERFAKRIARAIVQRRKERSLKTTFELVEIIKNSVPRFYRRGRTHFATRTFQALRIAVNDELRALEEGLEKTFKILDADGRLVVISFHSLEDRIVKNFMRQKAIAGEGEILTKKPVRPQEEEIIFNPRSRSAKLRAIKKWGYF